MAKKEHIARYSAEDLAGKRERGETRSDWARSATMTEEEIESDIASDPDEAGMVVDWDTASVKPSYEKKSSTSRSIRICRSAFASGSGLDHFKTTYATVARHYRFFSY